MNKASPPLLFGCYPERNSEGQSLLAPWLDCLSASWAFSPLGPYGKPQKILRVIATESVWLAVLEAWQQVFSTPCDELVVAAAASLKSDRRLVDMPSQKQSYEVSLLRALVLARSGQPVHLIFVDDQTMAPYRGLIGELANALGLSCGVITSDCTEAERRQAYQSELLAISSQQLMFDYLQDRRRVLNRQGPLRSHLARYLNRDCVAQTLLQGLPAAVITEARAVLIENTHQTLGISQGQDGDSLPAKTVYEEALECATQLDEGADFTINQDSRQISISNGGEEKIQLLSENYGPLWRGRERASALVQAALLALRVLSEGRGFVVEPSGVRITDQQLSEVLQAGLSLIDLAALVETARGESRSGTEGLVARINLQHFFPRYLQLFAAAHVSQPYRAELRRVYGLQSIKCFAPPPSDVKVKVFRSAEAKITGLRRLLLSWPKSASPPVLIVRDDAAKTALQSALSTSGIPISSDEIKCVSSVVVRVTTYDNFNAATEGDFEAGKKVSAIFYAVPLSGAEEMLTLSYCSSGTRLYASLEDEAFYSLTCVQRAMLYLLPLTYYFFKKKNKQKARHKRASVAGQDAHVRRVLAFSSGHH